jgi:hypothetical protein
MDTIIFDGGIAICKKCRYRRDDPEEEYPVESLTDYLNCLVELKPGTTLRHVWQFLERDIEFFDRVFHHALGRFSLQVYIDQARKPVHKNEDIDPDHSMSSLEVYWSAEVWRGEFSIHTNFGGLGRQKWKDADF